MSRKGGDEKSEGDGRDDGGVIIDQMIDAAHQGIRYAETKN